MPHKNIQNGICLSETAWKNAGQTEYRMDVARQRWKIRRRKIY